MAGVAIGIGGTAFLQVSQSSKILGAVLFSFGLLTICLFGLFLYTGKIAYVKDFSEGELALILLSNLIGIMLVGFLVSFALPDLRAASREICEPKLSCSPLGNLIKSFFCGVLMFIAVQGYKVENKFASVLIVMFSVIIFIMCGFEHCLANAFYFTVAQEFNLTALFQFLVMVIGNSLGSIVIKQLYDLTD